EQVAELQPHERQRRWGRVLHDVEEHAAPMSPLAASADTNSIDRISRTLALTRRLTTPIGMSERVMTGRIRGLACSHVHAKPSGPMPWPGSTLSTTAKVATSTMPTQ